MSDDAGCLWTALFVGRTQIIFLGYFVVSCLYEDLLRTSDPSDDPGAQLVAAGKELKEFIEQINMGALKNLSEKYGLNWILNRSADAPWQNGCTERLIRGNGNWRKCSQLS